MVKLLAYGARNLGSFPGLASMIPEICYFLLQSRDMAEISLKRRQSSKQQHTNKHSRGVHINNLYISIDILVALHPWRFQSFCELTGAFGEKSRKYGGIFKVKNREITATSGKLVSTIFQSIRKSQKGTEPRIRKVKHSLLI